MPRYTRLNRPNIRKLQPGEHITEHGIKAQCLANGDIKYSVNVMVDGERIHRAMGLASDRVTVTQCEDFIAQARTEAREGRLSLPQRRKSHLGFKDAADKYIENLIDGAGKNVAAKRRHMDQRLKPFFKSQRIDKISSFTVENYKNRRIEAGAEPGTVNRELATLSHLFSKAVDWKWIKAKPCRVIKIEEPDGRITVLSDDDIDALMHAALDDEDTYTWLFVAFGLNTAMRHSEIMRARFDQVDFEHARLFVPQAKAGQREQPLTPQLVDILKRERGIREDRDGWVFPSPRPTTSLSGHRDRMGKPFRRAVIAAGLNPDRVTPHVMRHTAITKLVKAGVDLPTVQKISGHKTLSMVLRYTHVHGSHIDEAISAIGTAIPEPRKNKNPDTITPKLHTVSKRFV
jgi:integrase